MKFNTIRIQVKDLRSGKIPIKCAAVVFAVILASCSNYTVEDVAGLWQLEVVELDAVRRPVSPTFIEIKPNRSFAVSRVSGDLAGVYRLDENNLSLYSQDEKWFNSSWSIYRVKSYLELKGKDERKRNLKLRFRKIEEIPDFEEFENKVVGKWQLYKIRNKGEVERLGNTWFEIDRSGNYTIADSENISEMGTAVINTRHRKIFFEKDKTEWSAWFYGEELRLTNDKSGMEYSLRKRN